MFGHFWLCTVKWHPCHQTLNFYTSYSIFTLAAEISMNSILKLNVVMECMGFLPSLTKKWLECCSSFIHAMLNITKTMLLTKANDKLCELYTYLLTPWCRVLLEKLARLQLVKKFPAFHGTRRFITALTSVRHLSLCWANPIQSTYPYSTSWRSILILSTHLRLGLPSGLGFFSLHFQAFHCTHHHTMK